MASRTRLAVITIAFYVSVFGGVSAIAQEPVFEPPPEAARFAGKWSVLFANGVKQVCTVTRMDGLRAYCEEPNRSSAGVVTLEGGMAVITFGDDRIERWTPIGEQCVVEHWFPAAAYPAERPVLGIAER